ncbi:MAG: acetoacetate decarboxylase family protein [Solirubrobacterales bacterium]
MEQTTVKGKPILDRDIFAPGTRYRMPVSFGPAIGPRQHPDGRTWEREETGTMNSDWMKVSYRTDADLLRELLPPGFSLRAEPIVSVSCAWFRNLYWLAGRGYGILSIDLPVTYEGASETIEGNFCPVIWEGMAEPVITGRDELGFPKLFADFTEIDFDEGAGRASCSVSSMGHRFFDIRLAEMVEEEEPRPALPGSGGGPQLYYKYVPRTSPGVGAGADAAYATTGAPAGVAGAGAQNISFEGFEFRRWTAAGELSWTRATFEQLPLVFPIVNALADLTVAEYVDAEMVSFSGPGIAVSTNSMRPVEPAVTG